MDLIGLRACSGIGFWPATGKFYFIQRYPVSNGTPDRPHTTANFALPDPDKSGCALLAQNQFPNKLLGFNTSIEQVAVCRKLRGAIHDCAIRLLKRLKIAEY